MPVPLNLPAGFGEMTPVWTLVGDPQPMTFSVGFRADPFSDDPGDMGVAAGDMTSQYIAAFAPNAAAIYEDWELVRIAYRFNTTASGIIEFDIPVGVAGSFAAPTPLVANAIVITKRTALGGRKHRGRVFQPPFDIGEADVSNTGYLDPTPIADLQAVWDSMLPDTPQTWQSVLLHTDPLDAPDDLTAFVVQNRLGLQKRRYAL